MRKTHNLHPSSKGEYEKSELEILKAVVQAWLSRHDSIRSSSSCSEFDGWRRNFHAKPSRFKHEAMRREKKAAEEETVCGSDHHGLNGSKWDFNQSLWDPYEIVAVSKRLEEGLMLDNDGLSVMGILDDGGKKFVINRVRKRRKESKNSLRNLFNMITSRRFDDSMIPH